MAMTREQFEKMVNRLEEFAYREPVKYRWRVALLAALGYAYVILILALVLTGVGLVVIYAFEGGRLNFVVIKFGWVLVALAVLVLRALWVHIPEPTGIEVTRVDAPTLFELAERITSALQAPPIHRVLITNDFNASVSQIPRLGPLGWHRNFLVLGLPLMQALSPEQFRAVLAHELGHLSGNHGRFSGWIYRVRQTWDQLLQRLQQDRGLVTFIFEQFFNWYAPFFHAYSFVLARAHEYEADRAAAKMAGVRHAAEALINIEVKAAYLSNTFWPNVFRQVTQQIEPPQGAYINMFHTLRSEMPQEDATRTLQHALAQETGHVDTHPSLAARLSALGYPPAGDGRIRTETKKDGQESHAWAEQYHPVELQETAAHHFLGSVVESMMADLDIRWTEGIRPQWRELHEHALASQKKLSELEQKAQREQLTDDERITLAYLTLEFKEKADAVPLFREIIASQPDNAAANYSLGQILLEENNADGIAYIEKAMSIEPDSILSGCEMLYYFLNRQGQTKEAEKYRERAQKRYDLLVMAQEERKSFGDKDEVEYHQLPPEKIARLREQLSQYPEIKAAYLARKKVSLLAEKPFYVLAISTKRSWYTTKREQEDNKLVQRLVDELEFPGETYVIPLYSKKLKKSLLKIEGTLLFERS